MLVFSIFYIFRTTGCRNSKNSNFPMKNIFFKIVKKEKVCEDNFKEIKILKSFQIFIFNLSNEFRENLDLKQEYVNVQNFNQEFLTKKIEMYIVLL